MKAILFILLLQSSSSFSAAQDPPKPNIIIVVADDLGYADTGFNGSKSAITPHLDHFAKSSVKLTDDPGEKTNLTGKHPKRAFEMLSQIQEFGTLQKPGATLYFQDREGYTAPKDWQIE